ncbi:MAG: hypothetical protein HYS98_00745, partial [Deltaproteobacteria bacterium]|nr:hypothetical protein [Deltaproteobacteria bacterium]
MKKTLGFLSLFVTLCAVSVGNAATAKVGPFDLDAKAKLSWNSSKEQDLSKDQSVVTASTVRNNVAVANDGEFDLAVGSFSLDASSNLFTGFNFMGGFAALFDGSLASNQSFETGGYGLTHFEGVFDLAHYLGFGGVDFDFGLGYLKSLSSKGTIGDSTLAFMPVSGVDVLTIITETTGTTYRNPIDLAKGISNATAVAGTRGTHPAWDDPFDGGFPGLTLFFDWKGSGWHWNVEGQGVILGESLGVSIAARDSDQDTFLSGGTEVDFDLLNHFQVGLNALMFNKKIKSNDGSAATQAEYTAKGWRAGLGLTWNKFLFGDSKLLLYGQRDSTTDGKLGNDAAAGNTIGGWDGSSWSAALKWTGDILGFVKEAGIFYTRTDNSTDLRGDPTDQVQNVHPGTFVDEQLFGFFGGSLVNDLAFGRSLPDMTNGGAGPFANNEYVVAYGLGLGWKTWSLKGFYHDFMAGEVAATTAKRQGPQSWGFKLG